MLCHRNNRWGRYLPSIHSPLSQPVLYVITELERHTQWKITRHGEVMNGPGNQLVFICQDADLFL